MIRPNEFMISATTLSKGMVLVTHNKAGFDRVLGFQYEDAQTT